MSPLHDDEADALREQLLTLLRAVAKARRVRAADVAWGAGMSDATLSRIFSGDQGLSLDNAVRLARWMGYELRLAPRDGTPS